DHNQTRTSQLPQDSRKTNKRMSFSTGIIPTTSVSRPQLKSNPMGDRVIRNNSQGKKQEVEDQRMNVKLTKNKTSITACNDSLNAKTLNVKFVSAMCDKCVLIDKHDINAGYEGQRSGTVAGARDTVGSSMVQKSGIQCYNCKEYGHVVRECQKPKRAKDTAVYYVEGFNHNLFSVGQFCDADLEVAVRKSTCFIRDLKGNDLLTGSHGTDLYSITLQDINCPNLIFLMAKATSSQAWLWHSRLSHLNFDTINLLSKNDIVVVVGLPKLKFAKDHLCSSCELGKAKRKSFHTKLNPSSKRRLQLLHMDLCGPMQTLHAYFAAEGIHHQTSVARTPEQNGIVKRRNHTLVEAARTMLSAAKSMALEHIILSPAFQHQANVPQTDRTVTMSNELDFLFSLMFNELLNGSSKVVFKSFAVSVADAPNQCLHHTTPLNIHTTTAPTCQVPTLAPTVTSSENKNQAEMYAENDQVADDEFINIFCTSVQDQGETSSRH
nr:integrase, catalytic region, zinc finger, CCHC-type, peptidase aspartic, catalytic [Tanacetum cinerariifolium]